MINSVWKNVISDKTELRHLPATQMHQLIGLLDIKDNWKLLASVIPNPDCSSELLFKTTDISILEEQRKRPGGSSANALLRHWSTYGRKRHTLGDAIHFLEQCDFIRAADVVRSCFINKINQEDENNITHANMVVQNDLIQKSNIPNDWTDLPEYTSSIDPNHFESIRPTAPNESLISCPTFSYSRNDSCYENLIRFTYKSLELATDNFMSSSIEEGGTKLGEGSFGEVFRCATALLNYDQVSQSKFVAVKRFKQLPLSESKNCREDFLSELNIMSHFRHPNLVQLYGYSDDGPLFCIVTEYLENGSLNNYLFGSVKRPKISFQQRLKITKDIAEAIVYLHTYTSINENGDYINKPFIHRDIKSANILLDNNLSARLGDLGLVRQGSTSNTDTTIVTKTVKGTSVYMAPEAFRGDVSVKVDTFSFGVVSLELCTGMAAFDSSRNESDMISYIDEVVGEEFDQMNYADNQTDLTSFVENAFQTLNQTKLQEILDKNCFESPNDQVNALKLLILSKCCIEERKRNRPTMVDVRKCLSFII